MSSSTTEDYLKQIYMASERSGESLASLGHLAQRMKVTSGTVTTMMKSLQEAGLVEYRPRMGVALTARGQKKALEMLRRHRLIELFLVEVIGLDWKYIHDEAEVLEHAISPRLLEKIDALLGHPSADPHGDPIPAADGIMPAQEGIPLSEATPPCDLLITRVEHKQEQFLDFLREKGLMPGRRFNLTALDNMAGTLTILQNGNTSIISLTAAELIHVVKIDPPSEQ